MTGKMHASPLCNQIKETDIELHVLQLDSFLLSLVKVSTITPIMEIYQNQLILMYKGSKETKHIHT